MCYIFIGDDMNKRGFTLIELMAVIVILSIILVVTTPIVINVISSVKHELSKQQKQIVVDAARMWGVNNLSVDDGNKPIYNSTVKESITIGDLKTGGFLERKDIKNISEEEMGSAGVCITYSNQFIYTFTENVANCSS